MKGETAGSHLAADQDPHATAQALTQRRGGLPLRSWHRRCRSQLLESALERCAIVSAHDVHETLPDDVIVEDTPDPGLIAEVHDLRSVHRVEHREDLEQTL